MAPAPNKLLTFGLVAAVGLIVGVGLVAAPVPKSPPPVFLVMSPHLAYLDSDGKDKKKIEPTAGNGALSRDGRRVAALEFDAEAGKSGLVIRSRDEKEEPVTVPSVFVRPLEGCMLV